jgi:hypothetical protein
MKNIARASMVLAIGLAFAISAKAQLHYISSDGTGSSTSATDAFYKIESNGSGNSLLFSNVTQSPGFVELDKASNRFFLYEAFTGVRGIKVFNLTTGGLINTIAISNVISSMEYDPVNDYIYYLTSDGVATAGVNDALVRVRPDGSGSTILKSTISPIPLYLALDIPHSKLYYYDGLTATRGVRTFDLTSNTITQTVSTSQLSSLKYYSGENYLYMLGTDGTIALNAADCLMRMHPDGSSLSTLAGSIAASPLLMALDIPKRKAYIYNALTVSKSIISIDLGTVNTVSTLINLTGWPAAQVVTGLATETSGAILPLQWLNVSGRLTAEKTAIINWSVQEQGVEAYTIEKSGDGRSFSFAGSVISLGDGTQNYHFTDVAPLAGNGYYRIKQTDRDGSISYSSVVKLSMSDAKKIMVNPNPATENTNIIVDASLLNTPATLRGSNGQVIRNIIITGRSFTLDLSTLAKGIYILQFADGTKAKIQH